MTHGHRALDHLSGRWSGVWGLRPDEFDEIIDLAFHEGSVLGFGRDAHGETQYSGSYDASGGISMMKRYTRPEPGQLHVERIYLGRWDGRRLSGGWVSLSTTRVAGGFHLWPGRGPEPKYLDPDPRFTWDNLLEAVEDAPTPSDVPPPAPPEPTP